MGVQDEDKLFMNFDYVLKRLVILVSACIRGFFLLPKSSTVRFLSS